MRREHTSGSGGSGLSTEDLATPRGSIEDEGRTGSPAFPGEATEPAGESTAPPARDEAMPMAEEEVQLLPSEDEENFHARWHEIQNEFVDDPREAVRAADTLVADVMQTMAATFAEHKKDLEGQWNRGEEANTEDLRRALRKYRSFFNRLLSA